MVIITLTSLAGCSNAGLSAVCLSSGVKAEKTKAKLSGFADRIDVFEKDGKKLAYGDWVINMHVPSSGKLTPKNCMQSLRMASEFFADRFPDGIVKFRCTSWLLSPLHQTCLPPESGIRQFASMFDLASVSPMTDGRELWRIFHRNYTGSTEGFPAETTLQRAYLKLLADGDVPQSGLGYIFMKDGKII